MRIGGLFLIAALAAGAASCDEPTIHAEAIACAATDPDRPTWVSHLTEEAPLCFPSPDGQKRVIVEAYRVRLESRPEFDLGHAYGGHIVWRPDSSGFGIFDADGSGQTSAFRYVQLDNGRPIRVWLLTDQVQLEFDHRFDCSGDRWFADMWPEGWTDNGEIRLVVQDGVHSEGCPTRAVEIPMIGVIGDPATGSISRILAANELRAEWCTPAERLEPGYCYDEALVERQRSQAPQ